MEINLHEITVRELVAGYEDDGEGGVVGYSGKLDIRPPYQREFVYSGKQRDAVIDTVTKGFPLNVMYWAVRDDGTYEIIDGQQRTISLAQYVKERFSFKDLYFNNLFDEQRNQILDYKLFVYLCSGTDKEKLDWFKIINIAGAKLEPQELRNAVYAGPWLSDAKGYFSRNGCAAYDIGKHYLTGSPIRQKYLETAIKWISEGEIEEYMARHQHESSAVSLWNYFQAVINWIEAIFPTRRTDMMKGLDWGGLYNEYKDASFDPDELEEEIKTLIDDDDVGRQKGIYHYVLTRDHHHLNIRAFDKNVKRRVYEKQEGICAISGKKFKIEEMEADHITPWSKGGRTVEENCQMVSKAANRRKGAK